MITALADSLTAAPGDSMVALTTNELIVTSGVDRAVRSVLLAPVSLAEDDALGAEVTALTHWGNLLLAVTADGLLTMGWGLDEASLPLEMPLGPAFLNGFLRFEADVAAIGVNAEQLDFVVEEGAKAATVSAGIEPPAPGGGIGIGRARRRRPPPRNHP